MRFNMLGLTGVRVPELSLGLGALVGQEQLDEVSTESVLPYTYWVPRLGTPERNPPLSGFRE